VVHDVLTSLSGAGVFLSAEPAPKGFMDTLPDPMKIDPFTLLFVMALVTVLFIFLKYAFFKPIIKVMDDRDAAILSGSARRAEAAALVEQRQADLPAKPGRDGQHRRCRHGHGDGQRVEADRHAGGQHRSLGGGGRSRRRRD